MSSQRMRVSSMWADIRMLFLPSAGASGAVFAFGIVQMYLESIGSQCQPEVQAAEPNSHLVKGDQPQTPDKTVVNDSSA
eukprot:2656624-Rhodomonas_salina.1